MGREVTAAAGATGPWRLVRRIGILAGGTAIVIAGVALLVLPGPGILTIVAGLSLLATEFTWARRLLAHVQGRLRAAVATAGRRRRSSHDRED